MYGKWQTSIQALFTIKIQEVSLEMWSVLLWQTNRCKKMHDIYGECGSDFILFNDAFHVLRLYVPSSSISLTRNTHPLYLTQLHSSCMFSALHLTCIITSVNTLNPSFLTFWTNPIHRILGSICNERPLLF